VDPVAAFANQKYLSLETYKKNGNPVRTVVWFTIENGVFYFHSSYKTWKLKRIRKNPAVRIAPSKFRGEILGEWFNGKAKFVPEPEASRILPLINRKYGLWGKIIISIEKRTSGRRVVVAIEPDDSNHVVE
jgi:PPOX class probable F420-dependent enzyme